MSTTKVFEMWLNLVQNKAIHLIYSSKTHEKSFFKKNSTNNVKRQNERFMLVLLAKCTTFYKYVKCIKRCCMGCAHAKRGLPD